MDKTTVPYIWDDYLKLPRKTRQKALKKFMRENQLTWALGEPISKKFELKRIALAKLQKQLEQRK